MVSVQCPLCRFDNLSNEELVAFVHYTWLCLQSAKYV